MSKEQELTSEVRALFREAREWLDRGCPEQGVEAIQSVCRLAPSWPQGWVISSLIYEELGQWEEAHAAATRATLVDPDEARTWCQLGLVEGEMGRTELAAEYLARAARLIPTRVCSPCSPRFRFGSIRKRRSGAHRTRSSSIRTGLRPPGSGIVRWRCWEMHPGPMGVLPASTASATSERPSTLSKGLGGGPPLGAAPTRVAEAGVPWSGRSAYRDRVRPRSRTRPM